MTNSRRFRIGGKQKYLLDFSDDVYVLKYDSVRTLYTYACLPNANMISFFAWSCINN